jgi:chromosome segregation protein
MLKALELSGFKSFADRTVFAFPPGITVVVGPNGSGKSNVVDAIKWALGEQSVKSLRGSEMADVIFNGSGTRRPMNSAEISLRFDNSSRLLDVDTPEVSITRRLYRSGDSEYLINRQPSRLRDIRDLLSGTGLGSHAYSVIEQGKVDTLLQASSRERRVIFEEAAGISRFKSKKLEALRRLDRVEQNLLRLSDIVDEVDSRLRGVRAQASKARRYQEYTSRLQELRTHVGLVDWRRLTAQLQQYETALGELNDQHQALSTTAESLEAELLETDTEIATVSESIRTSESRNAANRERIAAGESSLNHQRGRAGDLEVEVARYRRQLAALNTRAGDLDHQLQETGQAVEAEEQHRQEIARELAQRERQLTELIARVDQVRGESQQTRADYLKLLRDVADLGNRISALESQVAASRQARERAEARSSELDAQIDGLCQDLRTLRDQKSRFEAELRECRNAREQAETQLEETRGRLDVDQEELAELRQRRSGAAERAAVLEELHRRNEGLSAGVKEVLNQARAGAEGPLAEVCGLVADTFQVSVDMAPLVEIALGDAAQLVLVRRRQPMIAHLRRHAASLSGRVGFVWLDALPGAEPGAEATVDLEGKPGVMGRADRFVEAEARYAPLVRRLLGSTWFVETLDRALELASGEARGVRLVTLAGELVEADGTLVVGPRHASASLISRRSELRALREQLAEIEEEVGRVETVVAHRRDQIARQEQQLQKADEARQASADRLAAHTQRIAAAEERRSQLDQQRDALRRELDTLASSHADAVEELERTQLRRQGLESSQAELESRLAAFEQQLDQLGRQRQAHLRETTDAKVELAKSEERLGNLRNRLRQFEESQVERQRSIAEARQQLAQCRDRIEETTTQILATEAEIAELYLRKESFATETVELINQRETLTQKRRQATAEIQKLRNKLRKVEEKLHAKELEAGEIRHQRNSLAGRLREDYGIELADLEEDPSDEAQRQRDEVQNEIEELRRKINNLGNVNLEALAELQELETRHASLAEQFEDLNRAKTSLQRIIDKINADSRRLFLETLDTVRGHFQRLFRDLFGGGQGDIVLEDEEDVLESGVEIVARPPGKEPRSISLLSGGEKTLTCVALLLAIFRSRPSPFCVLDEVDAALDEANIDRFIKVLRDFLAWTQFIIVTHSKKTMTCANTIYGVTMQESGVSRQVSVRFEDVSEDGQISPEAARRSASAEAGDDDETAAA